MANPVRQLAAIMFTDLVGYTSLMNSNEDEAYRVLRKNRDLHNRLILQNEGRFLKEMGDGILASFSSTTNAVRCAIAIQQESELIAPLSLRIGIHLGEVLFEEEDVFGDGVNIASRIEAKAKPGTIYISESIAKTIKNRPEFESVLVGTEKLKNVSGPVRIYQLSDSSEKVAGERTRIHNQRKFRLSLLVFIVLVILVSIYSAFFRPDQGANSNSTGSDLDRSIAVLPFRNLSTDEINVYFTEGVMSAIHSHLSSINDLQVTSLTSSAKFREMEATSPEISEQLGVSYLVEGSVQKMADNYLISVNLIEGQTDKRVWNDYWQDECFLHT